MQHHYQAHTTPADAAKVATRAGAKKLALHHLVPGTVGDHILAAAEEHFSSGVLIPDDGEKIYFGDPYPSTPSPPHRLPTRCHKPQFLVAKITRFPLHLIGTTTLLRRR